MNNQPNQPDAVIDKTLAALNSATPPEGLEARIVARIAAQPAPTFARRVTFTPAWWSGAATGAAFALLAVAAVLLLQHKTPQPNRIAANAPSTTVMPVKVSESANPCTHPAVLLRTHTPSTAPAIETASSQPVPTNPLTAQERELVRLAQTADPRALATLNSEHQAELEAENAAQFDKFFTPPPRPPLPPDTQAANPQPDPAANPEVSPAANPETSPEAKPESDPSATSQIAPATSN